MMTPNDIAPYDTAMLRSAYVSEQLLDAWLELSALLGHKPSIWDMDNYNALDWPEVHATFASPFYAIRGALMNALEAQFNHDRAAIETAIQDRAAVRKAEAR